MLRAPALFRLDPSDQRPLRARCAWLVLLVCGAACGCRTFGVRRDGSPKEVAAARQLTEQGMSAMDRGDWKRAETLLAKAVATSSTDVDAHRQYAEALLHRGALHEGLAQLEAARQLAQDDPALAVRTGEVELAIGRPAEATSLADEALRQDPKYAPAWALRGRIASAAGQPRQALADYQRSLGYAPECHEVAIQIAETYRQLNQPERALLTLQAVADDYSRDNVPQQVLYLQGLALVALSRYGDAASTFGLAARAERPTAEILCRQAEAEMLAGHVTQAQSCVQEALAIDPQHAGSRVLSERMAAMAAAPRPPLR